MVVQLLVRAAAGSVPVLQLQDSKFKFKKTNTTVALYTIQEGSCRPTCTEGFKFKKTTTTLAQLEVLARVMAAMPDVSHPKSSA